MSETRVIHVKEWDRTDPTQIYIGRPVPRKGIAGSPWANPFPITEEMSRELSIRWFGEWVAGSPEHSATWIREHVGELRGRVLVCWCKDAAHPERACHGDILQELADADLG